MKAGFPISILPQTFKDAISVVRRFGARYLWIDSLCILQDSIEDWRREAVLMKDVYKNSLCNIAATGASNTEEGLFVDRDLSLIHPYKINLPRDGNKICILID
jgi:hypothetical protein